LIPAGPFQPGGEFAAPRRRIPDNEVSISWSAMLSSCASTWGSMKTGRVCAKQNRSWCCSETIEAGAISLFPTFLGLIIGVLWHEFCGAVISLVPAARSWLREHWPGSDGRLSRQDIRWLEWITIRLPCQAIWESRSIRAGLHYIAGRQQLAIVGIWTIRRLVHAPRRKK